MGDVIAFELEARTVARAGPEDVLDILEGVAEHEIAGVLEMNALPLELKILVFLQQREEAEVDRAHIEGGDLGLEGRRRQHTLLDLHIGAAAAGDIDYRIGALLDARQE